MHVQRCKEHTSSSDSITLRGATLLLLDKKRKLATTTTTTAKDDDDGRRQRQRRKYQTKRVQFARNLTTTYSYPPMTHSGRAEDSSTASINSTWYSDAEYVRFLHESRSTVQAAQRALQATGDLSTLDQENYTILGLEHFMSPSMEQEREQFVRHHCQQMIQSHRRESDSQS
jgi:hypothetical protein